MTSLLPILKSSRFAISLVILLCAAIIFAFDPGHMDGDAMGMLYWAKYGGYSDWYPLLLPSLLKASVLLHIGPVVVLAGQVLAIGISTYVILAFFWPPIIAAACTYAVLLCPAVLGYLGAITSHGLVTASLLCALAGLLHLTRPLKCKHYNILFVFVFAALSIASVARETGAAFTLPLFSVLLIFLMRRARLFESRRIWRSITAFAFSCILIVGVMGCGKSLLALLLHPTHNEPAEPLAFYDISAISLRAHHLFLDKKHFPNQSLDDLKKIFRKNDPDVLIFWGVPGVPPLRIYNDPVDASKLWHTWLECISTYPGYYITERYQMFRGLLGFDFRSAPAVPFHPGIDKNILGYHIAHTEADTIVVDYLKIFDDSFVDRPFIYFLLMFVAVGILFLMLPNSAERLVLLSLAAGSFLTVAGYFFVSPSTLLRYVWPSIVSNMVLVAVAAPYCIGSLRKRERALAFGKIERTSVDSSKQGVRTQILACYKQIRRIHLNFNSAAHKLSTPDFLKVDVWAIWFYVTCLIVFLVASILDLNGSSISIYHSIYAHGASEKPIIGQPHWIRMDEWGYHTPAILNQVDRLNPFRVKNSSLGTHSVSLIGNIPVAQLSTIFRPQFWPFFFLRVDYAYSTYWQFKALILITGVFTWLLLSTGSTLWAGTGSLWFFFSPFTQWAYSWPSLLPEMIGSACFATVFACYLTVGRSRLALTVAAVGFSTCAINFGLCAYLPHMLPLMWVIVLFFVGWCVAKRKTIWDNNTPVAQRIIVAALAIGLIAAVASVTAFQAGTAIKGIADTVYPGNRFYPSATMKMSAFLAQFLNWFDTEAHGPPGLGNICEVSGYLWLAPVALFCIYRLRLSHFKKVSLIALSCSSVLLLAWLLIPLPQWFGSMLALDRTGETRPIPALGLANIAIVVLVMSSFSKDERLQIRGSFVAVAQRIAGVFLVLSSLLVLTNHLLGWFFSWQQMLFAIAFTTILILLMIQGSQRVLPILLVIPSALAFGTVNPVERGLGVITSSAMYRFVRTDQDFLKSKWLVFSDTLWTPGFLTATGCQVYDGMHYLPDIDHFGLFAANGLDVKAFNQDGYLLAHAIGPKDKTSVQVVQSGWTRWNVSPSDPLLKQLGVKYVAFDRKPAGNIAAGLVPLSAQPVDNYWLYRIP